MLARAQTEPPPPSHLDAERRLRRAGLSPVKIHRVEPDAILWVDQWKRGRTTWMQGTELAHELGFPLERAVRFPSEMQQAQAAAADEQQPDGA